MKKAILSKSTFLRGQQCHKSLYLYKHYYHLRDEISEDQQVIFDQGTNVGLLAQKLFPNGIDASPSDHFKIHESVIKTKEYIERGETIIYEATFQFDGIIAAIDILVKDENGWNGYEVKSSTEVKDVYQTDAAIQYYVISNSGVKLKDISIVYINNKYIKNGLLDINQLFHIESVIDIVKELVPGIPNEVEVLKKVIGQKDIPDIDIGPHCSDPYGCDFMGYCWNHIPEYSIFNISRLRADKKFELYHNGVLYFEDLDLKNNSLNGNQLLQVKSALNKEVHIDQENISNFLEDITYPLYFLDFETINPAVPIYDKSRPYQQLVFQYSLHKQEHYNSELIHLEYLAKADPNIDPRIGFMQQLIKDCEIEGDIIVYNIGFERSKLNALIDDFPEYEYKLRPIINRLKDLMIPFQKKWYYTPEMKGSYSIKAVLPALVPELSYDDLEIKDGGSASNLFVKILNGQITNEIQLHRQNLKDYCKLDTFAMVKVMESLSKI
ncbi:DUF2779 domain-containing protein [Winogradskyella poriferorum]|uniref:DUF2779 domain-containing protein n=1 Tax=Winogradskyella poriferorum TaxID=307627 RepID=UPI003D6471A6